MEHARSRGAQILGEVAGCGSSTVADNKGRADFRKAVKNAMAMALNDAKVTAANLGHVHAHGMGTKAGDAAEALGINDVVGNQVPVVAAKGNFGNLWDGSGIVELIGSLSALGAGTLFPTCNYQTPDPACPIHVVRNGETKAGDSFVNVNYTPQGQASAIVVRKCA
jgi:3-oxoacyl-[acyl-carrier-protein] synthase II